MASQGLTPVRGIVLYWRCPFLGVRSRPRTPRFGAGPDFVLHRLADLLRGGQDAGEDHPEPDVGRGQQPAVEAREPGEDRVERRGQAPQQDQKTPPTSPGTSRGSPEPFLA